MVKLAIVPSMLVVLAMAMTCANAETFEEQVKATDLTNAEQVFALSLWCQEHNLPSKARQYLFQVIKIDKDHAEARTLLGQVRVGDRWVAKSLLNQKGGEPAKGGNDDQNGPVGPPPSAKDVVWNLVTIKDPKPANTFVNSYIERMSTVGNDSNAMEISISTLVTEDNLPTALPRLCAALQRPDFTDLYGPSAVIQALLKDGRRADARLLFPYVAIASLRCTDADDLISFAYSAAQLRDKRAIPRLIELMGNANTELASAAGEAVASITALPRDSMTVDKAISWWGRFYRTDEVDILRAQLKSKDPETALAAANQLGAVQEKKVIDVLIDLLKQDDPKVTAKALQLVTVFTGRDWAYVPTDPKEDRLKRVELLAKWWKENRETFTLLIDPRLVKDSAVAHDPGSATSVDPVLAAISNLAANDSKVAAKAEAELIGRAGEAVPALITGLGSDNPITSRKSHEILQRISKKSDIAFNPRDAAELKQKAIGAWRTWAIAQKFLTEDQGEEQE